MSLGNGQINETTNGLIPADRVDQTCMNCIHVSNNTCIVYGWNVSETVRCHEWINKTTFDLIEVARRAGLNTIDELPDKCIYALKAKPDSAISCSMCEEYTYEKDEFRLPFCSRFGLRRGMDKDADYHVCWYFNETKKPVHEIKDEKRREKDERYLNSAKILLNKGKINDYDLAKETMKHIKGKYISVGGKTNKEKVLWVYDGSTYQLDYNDALQKEALIIVDTLRDIARTFKNNARDEDEKKQYEVFQKSLENYLNIVKSSNLETMIKSMLSNEKIKFDDDLSKINTKNYLLDIITLKKVEHTPSQYYTKCLPYDWIPLEQAPLFNEHLNYMFPNIKTKEYVLEVLASCLFRKRKEEVVFFFWGPEARNGKTTLMQMVTEALGTDVSGYAAWLDYQTFTEARSKNATQTELKQAIGKAIAVIDEPAKESLSSGTVKNVSNFGKISFRGLYEETMEYRWTATLIFLCNTLPSMDTSDQGNARRPIVIPCRSKITDEMIKSNSTGIEKYGEYVGKKEAMGIFNTLLIYARKFAERGYVLPPMPEDIIEATEHYKLKGNTLLQFINERCVRQIEGKIKAGDFKNEFYIWCDTQGITRKSISFNIKEKMEGMGFLYKNSIKFQDNTVNTGYLGVTWRTEIGDEAIQRMILKVLETAVDGMSEIEICDQLKNSMDMVMPNIRKLKAIGEIEYKHNNFQEMKYFKT